MYKKNSIQIADINLNLISCTSGLSPMYIIHLHFKGREIKKELFNILEV